MITALADLVASFAITAAIECGLALLLFRSKRLAYAVLLANMVANPLMQLLLHVYVNVVGWAGYSAMVVGLEAGFLFAEAFVIAIVMGFRYNVALLRALPLNAASFAVMLSIVAAQR